jgi:putative endonuclease
MLYIGFTNDLERRMSEHKQKLITGYTSKYNLNRLVYFEEYAYVRDAIAREKQLKRWLRSRKVALIEEENPEWADLSANWPD